MHTFFGSFVTFFTSTADRFFKLFASLKLTVVILMVLMFGATAGMFWDQTLPFYEHIQSGGYQGLSLLLFEFFELGDVYHSWWFSLTILLLALNLSGCSLERLPKIWFDVRYPQKDYTSETLKAFPLVIDVVVAKGVGKTQLNRVLKGAEIDNYANGEAHYFLDKQKYSRFGVYVIHLSLLLIMFGSIVVTNLGMGGEMLIRETDTENKVHAKGIAGAQYAHFLDFDVHCKAFRIKTYIDDSPLAYESALEIRDKKTGALLKSATVRVNEPLNYGDYTFYQSFYRTLSNDERFKVLVTPHGAREGTLLSLHRFEKGRVRKGVFVTATNFLEDYGGLGPALQVKLEEAGVASNFYVFRQYPEQDPLVRRGDVDIFFQGSDHVYATGISVAKTPGLPIIFLGFVTMLIGLCMAFLFNHRRYYAILEQLADGRERVLLAGRAKRLKGRFEEEWAKIQVIFDRVKLP